MAHCAARVGQERIKTVILLLFSEEIITDTLSLKVHPPLFFNSDFFLLYPVFLQSPLIIKHVLFLPLPSFFFLLQSFKQQFALFFFLTLFPFFFYSFLFLQSTFLFLVTSLLLLSL